MDDILRTIGSDALKQIIKDNMTMDQIIVYVIESYSDTNILEQALAYSDDERLIEHVIKHKIYTYGVMCSILANSSCALNRLERILSNIINEGRDSMLNPQIINNCKTQEVCSFLLRNGMDVTKARYISDRTAAFILHFIINDKLPTPLNPNAMTPSGAPFWQSMVRPGMEAFFLHGCASFTEKIDLYAKDYCGNTYFHNYSNIPDYMFELGFDFSVKNNAGHNAFEYHKFNGMTGDLEHYIKNKEMRDEIKRLTSKIEEIRSLLTTL